MIKKVNKKKMICALVLSCLIGTVNSIPTAAAEVNTDAASQTSREDLGIETYSYYIEPCWICNKGDIYREIKNISRHFSHSVKCQHGYTKGTDNYYTVSYAHVNTCNNCGYGWTDPITRTEVECEGYY
ncbi:MAG: hypothetical protein NC123_03935 [Butyrivibrio sp.]|nr:hypothetical protein [Acetatifactor muris]MCM1558682.1 hypothetical protein [Butyrivibrio sp.]